MAVVVERGTRQLVALIAVWWAGGAYVCPDADQPRERLDLLVELWAKAVRPPRPSTDFAS